MQQPTKQPQEIITSPSLLQQLHSMVHFLNGILGPEVELSLQDLAAEGLVALEGPALCFKDGSGNPQAMLCVKRQPSSAAVSAAEITTAANVEAVNAMTIKAVNELLAQQDLSPDHLNMQDRLEIVQALSQRGIFLYKGAVSQVARQLHCSEPSIYRYLSLTNKPANETSHLAPRRSV